MNIRASKHIDRSEVVRRHKEGASVIELARHFECSTVAIRYHLKRAEQSPTIADSAPQEVTGL